MHTLPTWFSWGVTSSKQPSLIPALCTGQASWLSPRTILLGLPSSPAPHLCNACCHHVAEKSHWYHQLFEIVFPTCAKAPESRAVSLLFPAPKQGLQSINIPILWISFSPPACEFLKGKKSTGLFILWYGCCHEGALSTGRVSLLLFSCVYVQKHRSRLHGLHYKKQACHCMLLLANAFYMGNPVSQQAWWSFGVFYPGLLLNTSCV